MENTKTDEFDINVQDYMWRTQIHQLDRIRYLVGKLSEIQIPQHVAGKFRDKLNDLEDVTCFLLSEIGARKAQSGN